MGWRKAKVASPSIHKKAASSALPHHHHGLWSTPGYGGATAGMGMLDVTWCFYHPFRPKMYRCCHCQGTNLKRIGMWLMFAAVSQKKARRPEKQGVNFSQRKKPAEHRSGQAEVKLWGISGRHGYNMTLHNRKGGHITCHVPSAEVKMWCQGAEAPGRWSAWKAELCKQSLGMGPGYKLQVV